MSHVKIRLLAWTHLHHLVGSGRELPTAELPTVRNLIRYGLYLGEMSDQDGRNCSKDQVVTDLMIRRLAQWCRANPKFTEPVINTYARIKAKLKSMWEQGNKVSSGRANLEEKDSSMESSTDSWTYLPASVTSRVVLMWVATLPVIVQYTYLVTAA